MSLPQTQQRAPTGQGSKMSASNLSGGPSSAIVGSARPREIRSSRRKLGSTGPAVVLGGGVGILGSGSSQREVSRVCHLDRASCCAIIGDAMKWDNGAERGMKGGSHLMTISFEGTPSYCGPTCSQSYPLPASSDCVCPVDQS